MLLLRSPWLWIILVASGIGLAGQARKTFSISDSVLLFGDYNELYVVTADGAQHIHPPVEVKYNSGYFAYPAIAPAGDMIAWGFATKASASRTENRVRFSLGLYSTTTQKWRTYGDFGFIGDAAFSPDGTRVAVVAHPPPKLKLLIFDIAIGSFTERAYPGGMPNHSNLSWSPDATRLVMEIQRAEKGATVSVLDLSTENVRELSLGFGARWSPTGEWIAYYTPDNECMLVHPDGTGAKVVAKLGSSRNFGWGSPVWSPDSTQLLLNVSKNGGPLLDVVLLDLVSGRMTTKSHSGVPVFGWVRLRR
jgi:hypothetical protein